MDRVDGITVTPFALPQLPAEEGLDDLEGEGEGLDDLPDLDDLEDEDLDAEEPPVDPEVARREKVLGDYRKVLLHHKETEAKVKQSTHTSRRPHTPHGDT